MAAPQLGVSKRVFVIRHEFFTLQSPLTNIPFCVGTTSNYNSQTLASECSRIFPAEPGLLSPKSASSLPLDDFKSTYRAFQLPPRSQESLVLDLLREALMKKSPCVAVMNPRIVGQSSETFLGNEGCFSVPDWQALVERPLSIDVEFDTFDHDPNSSPFDSPNPFDPSADHLVQKKLTLREFAARSFLHEVDHLNGTIFVDKASPESFYFVANAGEAIYADELTENEMTRAPQLTLQYPVLPSYDAYA